MLALSLTTINMMVGSPQALVHARRDVVGYSLFSSRNIFPLVSKYKNLILAPITALSLFMMIKDQWNVYPVNDVLVCIVALCCCLIITMECSCSRSARKVEKEHDESI